MIKEGNNSGAAIFQKSKSRFLPEKDGNILEYAINFYLYISSVILL